MKKYETIENCLEANRKLLEALDSTDAGAWHYRQVDQALKHVEAIDKILSKVIEDDEMALAEEAFECSRE